MDVINKPNWMVRGLFNLVNFDSGGYLKSWMELEYFGLVITFRQGVEKLFNHLLPLKFVFLLESPWMENCGMFVGNYNFSFYPQKGGKGKI